MDLGGRQRFAVPCQAIVAKGLFLQIQKRPLFRVAFFDVWLREPDLNRRPSGYEPDELPDCSIPRLCGGILQRNAGVSTVNRGLGQINVNCPGKARRLHLSVRSITRICRVSVMSSKAVGKNTHAQKRPLFRVAFFDVWLREPDLNRRPSGYEPDELPDCSIPRLCVGILQRIEQLSTQVP